MPSIIIIGLLMVMPVFALAQESNMTQTVRGVVRDQQTQSPLPGTNIVITSQSPQTGTISDEKGYFRFEDIEIGRINLHISYLGYYDVIYNNLELNLGRELILTVEMEESGILGEEVTIRHEVDKSSPVNRLASVSARSFTVEETERYAGSFNDVARMASNFAGVMGNDDSRNDIIIRGNSPAGLLWRLEGVDIPNPNHWGMMGTTGGPVSMLNNTLLDNSDFLTGAFPAEYGNATSGVFDLRMRNGNNEQYEFLGQIGFNGVELGAEGPLNKDTGSSFLVNYRYSTLALFYEFGMDFGTVGVPYYQDVSFKVNFPNTRLGRLSIFGLAGKSDIEIWDSRKDTINERLDLYGIDGFDITSSTEMAVVGINQLYHINSNTYTRVSIAGMTQAGYNKVDTISPVTYSIEPFYGDRMNEQKLFTSAVLNKRFSFNHHIRTGIMASFIESNLKDSIYNKELSQWSRNFNHQGRSQLLQTFIQWQFRPIHSITINSGLHQQYFFLNNRTAFDPRIGLKWAVAPKHTVSLGYGIHHQTITPIAYFLRSEEPDGTASMPNTNLKHLRSRHIIFGHDYRINQHTRIKTELYHQDASNAAVDATAPNAWSILNQGASFQFSLAEKMTSKGTGQNKGAEFTIERFLHRGIYWLVTASFFESKYTGSNEILNSSAFNNNHVVNALFGKELEIRKKNPGSRQTLSVDFKTTHAGGMRATPWEAHYIDELGEFQRVFDHTRAFSRKLKDYARTDISLTFKSNKGKITQQWGLEITNLFNRSNIYSESFNRKTGDAEPVYQLGRLIIPQYRVIF